MKTYTVHYRSKAWHPGDGLENYHETYLEEKGYAVNVITGGALQIDRYSDGSSYRDIVKIIGPGFWMEVGVTDE